MVDETSHLTILMNFFGYELRENADGGGIGREKDVEVESFLLEAKNGAAGDAEDLGAGFHGFSTNVFVIKKKFFFGVGE